MDKFQTNPVTRSGFHPISRFIAGARRRFQAWLALITLALPHLALAEDADIIGELRSQLGPILTVGLQLLLVGGFATAGYIIITGAIRVMQDREGGLARFGLGILVAIIMIAFTVYLVGEGSEAVTLITGGTGGTGN